MQQTLQCGYGFVTLLAYRGISLLALMTYTYVDYYFVKAKDKNTYPNNIVSFLETSC